MRKSASMYFHNLTKKAMYTDARPTLPYLHIDKQSAGF